MDSIFAVGESGGQIMATADQLKALLKSYADGDDDRFLAVSMQVASHAAHKGRGSSPRNLGLSSTKRNFDTAH